MALIALRGRGTSRTPSVERPPQGRFTAEAIALWERLAGYLAVALAKTLAEEELQKAKAAAEAANEAKTVPGQHQPRARTPMNAILGMIDVALPKAMDPTVKDCLQTAKGSADLLLTLLNDLLDSAKIESGSWSWNRPRSACGGCWTRSPECFPCGQARRDWLSIAGCPTRRRTR